MSSSYTRIFLTLLIVAVVAHRMALLPGSGAVAATPDVAAPRLGADALRGRAAVLDGDTVDVAGRRVRLDGIDAPEGGQMCARRTLGQWACGTASTYALFGLMHEREVACDVRGEDRFGRTLAVCFVDGRDINAEMVRLGLAWAFVKYSQAYVREEAEARAARRGVWTAATMPPWQWRETHRGMRSADLGHTAASAGQPPGCTIKGNVTRFGRIYHTPASPWYARIVVDESQGRRWFCTEGEAIAAGWRPVFGLGGG